MNNRFLIFASFLFLFENIDKAFEVHVTVVGSNPDTAWAWNCRPFYGRVLGSGNYRIEEFSDRVYRLPASVPLPAWCLGASGPEWEGIYYLLF